MMLKIRLKFIIALFNISKKIFTFSMKIALLIFLIIMVNMALYWLFFGQKRMQSALED